MFKKDKKLINQKRKKYQQLDNWPAKITFKMQNGIVLNDYLMLDSLLAYAVLKDILGSRFENVTNSSELIEVPLPLKKTGETWHSSAGIFNVIEADQSTWKKRWDSTDNNLVNPHKRRTGKYSLKIDVGSGNNKAYSMPLQMYLTKEISFYINGNGNEIMRLLKENIKSVGKKRSQGYGMIMDMQIEPKNEDESIIWNGKIARPITYDDFISSGFADQAYEAINRYMPNKPPYWNTKESKKCLAPENINVRGD